MYDQTTTIGDFLSATAAKQPAPGGGSVAALTGALAAAIGEMTLNYSVDRKANIPETEGMLRQALLQLDRARQLMLELMREDQLAYDALTAARKMPADFQGRQSQVNVTLLACLRIPQAMAACGLAILELVDKVWEVSNPYLLSDMAVCAELAMATVRCGVYNVRANLPFLNDAAERMHFEMATEKLLVPATEIMKRNSQRIWQRYRLEVTA
ncbi:MAG TPA: cyclodeaminase/cyclohydrolase family protein [Tepidisphaeraceae bacterium]|jgi:formiminotetrahydrofolate cyclodeaminase